MEQKTQNLGEAIFTHTVEAILVVDARGNIRNINPKAEELFGYEEHELVGKNISVLIPANFRQAHQGYVHNYSEQPHARTMGEGRDLYGQRKDGVQVPVLVSLSPVVVQEQSLIVALVFDITEQKEVKEKLKQLNEELENKVEDRTRELAQLVNQLEKSNAQLRMAEEDIREALKAEKGLNELKSRFVSMASHEFRTPLGTIMSSASLIEKYGAEVKFNDRRTRQLQRIKSNVRSLTSILNEFLSLDKLQEGKIQPTPSTFDLKSLCDEVLEDLKEHTKSGQVLHFNQEGVQTVCLDKNLMKNVLINLLSNAIKYSSEGKNIWLKTSVEDDEMILLVKDEGIGIPEEEQEHLFERFFRAKNATNIQGTGLGLNIVKRYVELMGGSISYTSRFMEGTTFRVKIPMAE